MVQRSSHREFCQLKASVFLATSSTSRLTTDNDPRPRSCDQAFGPRQEKLAKIGITEGSPVSIALPNTYEFIVSFLASAWQRGIAAPLNPAYKQSEFEFYIDDLSSAVALVPKGAFAQDAAAVRAARKYEKCTRRNPRLFDDDISGDRYNCVRWREQATERVETVANRFGSTSITFT